MTIPLWVLPLSISLAALALPSFSPSRGAFDLMALLHEAVAVIVILFVWLVYFAVRLFWLG
jgi:hypothetical protein